MLIRKASVRVLVFFLCLAMAGAATIPRQSPEFAMNTTDGKQILLSQYRGKAVVFAFILTSCPHCQQTIGILSKLQPEYASRGVQVLACAIEDAARQNVPGFIAKFHPPFPVGYCQRDSVYEYLQHPNMLILHMPALLFIDRRGSIRAQYAGDAPIFAGDGQEKSIRDEMEKLLKEGAVTSRTAAPKGGVGRAAKP